MHNSNSFDVYLKNLADCDVMPAELERQRAAQISALRERRWQVVLSQPHFVESVLELAGRLLPSPVPEELAQGAIDAAFDLIAARNKRTLDSMKGAAWLLSEHLSAADRDQVVSDTVLADLTTLQQGLSEPTSLKVELPRGRDQTFRQYVARVRRAAEAFWVARQAFAKANLRLVVSMARRIGRGRMAMPDLVQEGNIGLMQAIDRFDHTKGFRFSTYGAWWIRHAMNRALQNKSREIRLPVHIQDALHKVNRVRREYEALHGEPISVDVLGQLCDLTPAKIAKLDRHYLVSEYPTSLDVETSDNGERDRIEMSVEERPALPIETLEDRATNEVVSEALEGLPEMEQMILRMRFGLDTDQSMTLREIGEHYSLSRERIRQLQERALGRIRTALQSQELM